jgi:hypothetical protein
MELIMEEDIKMGLIMEEDNNCKRGQWAALRQIACSRQGYINVLRADMQNKGSMSKLLSF